MILAATEVPMLNILSPTCSSGRCLGAGRFPPAPPYFSRVAKNSAIAPSSRFDSPGMSSPSAAAAA